MRVRSASRACRRSRTSALVVIALEDGRIVEGDYRPSSDSTNIASQFRGRYAPEIETAVYFRCLEALQNAAKHAGVVASARQI